MAAWQMKLGKVAGNLRATGQDHGANGKYRGGWSLCGERLL